MKNCILNFHAHIIMGIACVSVSLMHDVEKAEFMIWCLKLGGNWIRTRHRGPRGCIITLIVLDSVFIIWTWDMTRIQITLASYVFLTEYDVYGLWDGFNAKQFWFHICIIYKEIAQILQCEDSNPYINSLTVFLLTMRKAWHNFVINKRECHNDNLNHD